MGKHVLTVHNKKVYCADDRSYRGVKFLAYEMDKDEAKKLFEQAEHTREVSFEDDDNHKFMLVDGENNTFTVVEMDKPDGWF